MRNSTIYKISFLVCLTNVFFLLSCIKSYYPDIDNADEEKFVVTGQIIEGDTLQVLNISTTTPMSKYFYTTPVTGCTVLVCDDRGNTFTAVDLNDGNYQISIPEDKLIAGTSFMVDISVPAKEGGMPVHLVSDFDKLYECPEIDTIYYYTDSLPNLNPLAAVKGIRFCIDLDASSTDSRFFRFDLTETWEYHATLAAVKSPQKKCWMTGRINDIFLLSTLNLTTNKYHRYPFHFVDNISTQRLGWCYSLLVRQYTLSEPAYEYWNKIRINSAELGNLYGKQPVAVKGNVHNLSNPEQQVLGFFGAASARWKRIFIKDAINVPYLYTDCEIFEPPPPPDPQCFNCLLSGGTNIKPDFWPY